MIPSWLKYDVLTGDLLTPWESVFMFISIAGFVLVLLVVVCAIVSSVLYYLRTGQSRLVGERPDLDREWDATVRASVQAQVTHQAIKAQRDENDRRLFNAIQAARQPATIHRFPQREGVR